MTEKTIIFIVFALCLLLFAAVCVLAQKLKKSKRGALTDKVTGGLNYSGILSEIKSISEKERLKYAAVTMKLMNYEQMISTFGNEDSEKALAYVEKTVKANLGAFEPFGRTYGGTFFMFIKNRSESDISTRLGWFSEKVNAFNAGKESPYVLDLKFGVYLSEAEKEPCESLIEKSENAFGDTEKSDSSVFFCRDGGEIAAKKWEYVNYMDKSFEDGDFVVYFQPKVSLTDGRINGAEAILHWRHPKDGLLCPASFVPVFEEYRLSEKLDRFLFEFVCRKISEWTLEGLMPCPVSMNITYGTLCSRGIIRDFSELCQKYGVEPKLIEIELDEKTVLKNPETVCKLVEKIHSAGFRCAFDGFGKDALPLDLIRVQGADSVKLDKDFFSIEHNDRRNRFLAEGIFKYASQMQIASSADGIENKSQVRFLQQAGCDSAQGFFFFSPMSAEEFRNTAYTGKELAFVDNEKVSSGRGGPDDSEGVIMFSYSTADNAAVFSDCFSPALGGEINHQNAYALFEKSALVHENDRKDFLRMLARCRENGGKEEGTVRFCTGEGRYEWLEAHLHRVSVQPGGNATIAGTLVNKDLWKKEVKRWQEKAHRDPLTGLYNREYFEQTVGDWLENKKITQGAMVYIDVNDFKTINDTLGHTVGDDVLCYVSKRFLSEFRHSDVVARYGGDEFVVFVNGISREDIEKRLLHLCSCFKYPYRNGNIERQLALSIGVALVPDDGFDYQHLIESADCAMYSVKYGEVSRFAFFKEGMDMADFEPKKRGER